MDCEREREGPGKFSDQFCLFVFVCFVRLYRVVLYSHLFHSRTNSNFTCVARTRTKKTTPVEAKNRNIKCGMLTGT